MLRELLKDTFAYIQPAVALDDLAADDAMRKVAGAAHCVAEIVAHLAFWQDWFLARCDGEGRSMVAAADVDAAGWIPLRAQFLLGLDTAVALSEDAARVDHPISPAIDFPPLAGYTVRDALTHIAVHNAHPLGQVVTLRQMIGRWPPPAGPWTW